MNVDTPMVKHWKAGTTRYRPVFYGEPLEIENGTVEVTLRNLKRIEEKMGLTSRVVTILVGPRRQVLIIYSSGETYLATGFVCGDYDDIRGKGLAHFIIDSGLSRNPFSSVFKLVAQVPEDFTGELPFDNLDPPGRRSR